jgi:hypothetical protein
MRRGVDARGDVRMNRLCALFAVLVLGVAGAAQALPGPTISIEPMTVFVEPGDLFALDVSISEEVLGVTGYDLIIDFDETLLEVVNVIEGALPAGSPPTYFWWTDEGTESQSIVINGAVLGHSVDGPGTLAELRFRALELGVTPVHFVSVQLRRLDNSPISVTPLDGEVTIEWVTVVEPSSWSKIKSLFR